MEIEEERKDSSSVPIDVQRESVRWNIRIHSTGIYQGPEISQECTMRTYRNVRSLSPPLLN